MLAYVSDARHAAAATNFIDIEKFLLCSSFSCQFFLALCVFFSWHERENLAEAFMLRCSAGLHVCHLVKGNHVLWKINSKFISCSLLCSAHTVQHLVSRESFRVEVPSSSSSCLGPIARVEFKAFGRWRGRMAEWWKNKNSWNFFIVYFLSLSSSYWRYKSCVFRSFLCNLMLTSFYFQNNLFSLAAFSLPEKKKKKVLRWISLWQKWNEKFDIARKREREQEMGQGPSATS